MRFFGLFIMGLLFGACTTPPIFPPDILKDVETKTFDFKAWKDQALQSSSITIVPRKVELGGRILNVARKPEGVVILADEQAIEKYAGYCPECVKREYSSTFAIVFNGPLESSMLQVGNELAVVGTTDRPGPEMIDGTPQVLPHLSAQCLHIWKTEAARMPGFTWEGAMGYLPPEHGIFCRDERTGKSSVPGGSHG